VALRAAIPRAPAGGSPVQLLERELRIKGGGKPGHPSLRADARVVRRGALVPDCADSIQHDVGLIHVRAFKVKR